MKYRLMSLASGVIVLAAAVYISHPLLIRYIAKQHLQAQMGANTLVDLSDAQVTGKGLLLQQLSIERPGMNIKIPLLSIGMDPWKYLFGRKVIDNIKIGSAKVRVSIDAIRKNKKRGGEGHHRTIPVFNHLLMNNVSIIVQNKGREIGSLKGWLKVDIRSGHEVSRSYDISGSLDAGTKNSTHQGKLNGTYSFSKKFNLILSFNLPVKIPFGPGTAIIKDIRLYDQGLGLPSCGLKLPGMDFSIKGLAIKIADTNILSGFTNNNIFHGLKEVHANHVVLHLLRQSGAVKVSSVTTKQDLQQRVQSALAFLNKKTNRLRGIETLLLNRKIPQFSILKLDIIHNMHKLISGVRLDFIHKDTNQWLLNASGRDFSLSVSTLKDQGLLESEMSWHLPGCKFIDMVLPGIVTVDSGCISDMKISGKMYYSNAWSMDVGFILGPVTLNHHFLCEKPVRFHSIGLHGRFLYYNKKNSLKLDKTQVDINGIRLNVSLLAAMSQHPMLDLKMDLPDTKAMDLLRDLPESMSSQISGMKFAGTFAFNSEVNLDLTDLTKSNLSLQPDCTNLRLVSVPDSMDIAKMSGNFIQTIHTDDKEIKRRIGPDSPDWVSFDDIPPYFIDCLLASEDVTFFKHHGFYKPAIKKALIDDLTSNRIVRGASTISQQLTKNLFLSKSKSIGRKLQEAVLTWYLESVLSKQRILELYLNIIEWGPGIYGIRQASMHYFGKEPSTLDLAESAFLVAIIPSPVKWHKECIRLKRVPKLIRKKIVRILRILVTRNVIDKDVIKVAMKEPIDFNTETIGLGVH